MPHWIENPPDRCGFEWLRYRTTQGEHWAGCENPPGHGGRHQAGVSYVLVGAEHHLTHRWNNNQKGNSPS